MDDIRLDSNGDLYIHNHDIQATNSIAQRINIHLKWFLAESPFRPDFGVDYYGKVFIKRPNSNKVINMLSREILSVEGVLDVPDIEMSIDNSKRKAEISYTVKTTEGIFKEEVELWIMA